MTTLTQPDRKSAADDLAQAHRKRDAGLQAVRWYTSGPADEIRLLEVSSEISTTHEVFPVRFKAQTDFPFSTVVVLVSPEELCGIDSGDLELPNGWGEHFKEL